MAAALDPINSTGGRSQVRPRLGRSSSTCSAFHPDQVRRMPGGPFLESQVTSVEIFRSCFQVGQGGIVLAVVASLAAGGTRTSRPQCRTLTSNQPASCGDLQHGHMDNAMSRWPITNSSTCSRGMRRRSRI